MIFSKKNILLFLSLALIFFAQANFSFALEAEYPSVLGVGQLNNNSTLPDLVKYFFNIGVAFAGTIALLTITFGGIKYLLDYGRGKFTSDAKDIIKAGVLGLLIITCSYLIMFTINPQLLGLKLDELPDIIGKIINGGKGNSFLNTITFQEIPIGKLAEETLTVKTYCYAYDSEGNPIDGDKMKTDNGQESVTPTHLDHDVVDCMTLLGDAAQKKGKVTAMLSNEINKLMDQCICTTSTCTSPCNKDGKGCDVYSGACPAPGGTGNCTGACAKKNNPYETKCLQQPGTSDCCPAGVKDKIEHGAIKLTCENGAEISIEPNFKDSSFTNPTTSNAPCVVGTIARVTKPQNIVIGSSVPLGDVQWAIDQWNSQVPSPLFGSITVSDAIVNSYCFPNSIGGCEGGKPPAPAGLNRIYNRPINTYGAIPWQPPAFANWKRDGAGNISRFDINMDTTDSYKLTILHELGHAAGLDDSYDKKTGRANPGCNYKSVMNNHRIMSGVGPADIEALKNLYGSNSNNNTNNPTNTTKLKDPFDTNNPFNLEKFNIKVVAKAPCANCDVPKKEFKGLDEFRCPIKPVNQNSNDKCSSLYNVCTNIASAVEKEIKINKKTIKIIDREKWDCLNLLQQMTYYKEKINEQKKLIDNAATALTQGADKLSKCYMAAPYVDVLKLFEKTDQKVTLVLPRRDTTVQNYFYCKGFNYANSSCFKKCNDLCPDDSMQALSLYRSCQGKKGTEQEVCIAKAYGERSCPKSNNAFKNWNECLSSCKNDCTNLCAKKYSVCSEELKICQNKCNNDTQCLIDNANSCLFGAQGFVNCATQTKDDGNAKYCIENAYLCKNGSDQNAGYPECNTSGLQLGGTAGNSTATCSPFKYSATYVYDHPECLKCKSATAPPPEGTTCYNKAKTDEACQVLCPETTKCSPSSSCANCKCDQIEDKYTFYISGQNVGTTQSATIAVEQNISAHQLVGPECNNTAYNDDPLTFFCQDNWWMDPNREGLSPTPIGQQRVCTKDGEIPVGRVIDDTLKWAAGIGTIADKIKKGIDDMATLMKKAGNAKDDPIIKDYCKCNARFESKSPICNTDCRYNQNKIKVPVLDANGQPVLDANGDTVTQDKWVCSCNFIACNGKPCQQVMNYLAQMQSLYGQVKLNYIYLYTTLLQEPRSDVLKELTYSRQKINTCSLTYGNYGKQARMLSCTRAEDELITPINSDSLSVNGQVVKGYCYGQKLGKAFGVNLNDNWFCCEEWNTTAAPKN